VVTVYEGCRAVYQLRLFTQVMTTPSWIEPLDEPVREVGLASA
jgi:hypothetical protein